MSYTAPVHSYFWRIICILVLLMGVGTLGYHWIEGWGLTDSLYMVIITLSTIGYGEVNQLSDAGRWFTMALIVGGVSLVTYSVGTITRMVVEGELQTLMGRRRTMSKIRRLKDHYIICGYGRIGGLIAQEFDRRPLPFVVVERDEDRVSRIPQQYPVVVGDATEESVLLDAGIERAKGLVTVLQSDADNLFVTLTARELNPKLLIIARYEEPRSEAKLLRAGADKVVSPYIIGGTRMAMAILRPAVIDFIELATQSESLGLQMEEVLVVDDSPLAGVKLVDSSIRSELDIMIVAIKKRSGHMEFNPSGTTVLDVGDRLIAIGERGQLRKLEVIAHGPVSVASPAME
ncbi:MAG: potassium channel protein [Deferrisomatales bacterium]|nr:potassium channel protein [Deferrisomatales bacterium]